MSRRLLNERFLSAWGICEPCDCVISIKVHDHPEGSLPPESEWASFGLACPVCGDTVDWESADTVDDEEDE